jgi:hypothetical protein
MDDRMVSRVGMELVTDLCEVIRLQSDCIDKMFLLLCQQLTAEELAALPALEKLDKAARLMADYDI